MATNQTIFTPFFISLNVLILETLLLSCLHSICLQTKTWKHEMLCKIQYLVLWHAHKTIYMHVKWVWVTIMYQHTLHKIGHTGPSNIINKTVQYIKYASWFWLPTYQMEIKAKDSAIKLIHITCIQIGIEYVSVTIWQIHMI